MLMWNHSLKEQPALVFCMQMCNVKTIQNTRSPQEVIRYLRSGKHHKDASKKQCCYFVFAFPPRRDISGIYLGRGSSGDTLEGEFPMSGGNQLFIRRHAGLSSTLTAAEVALRLRTSMDGCVSHVYSFFPMFPSLLRVPPLAAFKAPKQTTALQQYDNSNGLIVHQQHR